MKVKYLKSIIQHKRHNPSIEMHLDINCDSIDSVVDEVTSKRDDGRSKIGRDFRDPAHEYSVKIGCDGGGL